MAGEPGHDPEHGTAKSKRAFATIYRNEGLYEMGFPHILFWGTGGPSHRRARSISELELVFHLLRLYHRRFSQDASFLFFAHSVIPRRTVIGVTRATAGAAKRGGRGQRCTAATVPQ